MTYKFLNGARRAGVMLALVLLGVSSVWAKDVVINLGDISNPNATTGGNGTDRIKNRLTPSSADARKGIIQWNTNVAGTVAAPTPDVFAKWVTDGTDRATDSVVATFNWIGTNWTYKNNTVGNADYNTIDDAANAAKAVGAYDSTLTIWVGSTVTRVLIQGTLKTGIGVHKILFKRLGTGSYDESSGKPSGNAVTTGSGTGLQTAIIWDGAVVSGATTEAARRVDKFLVFDQANNTNPDKFVRVSLQSGSITSAAKSIIRDVGGNVNSLGDPDYLDDNGVFKFASMAAEGIVVGYDGVNEKTKNLTLVGLGGWQDSTSGLIEGTGIVLLPGAGGQDSIINAFAPAIVDNGTLVIGSKVAFDASKTLEDGIYTPEEGNGKIVIKGFNSTAAVTSKDPRAAIWAKTAVVIIGREGTGGAALTRIESKGAFAVRAKDGAVRASNANFVYSPPSAVDGGSVFLSEGSAVELYKVNVSGPSATVLNGALVRANGNVDIEQGTYQTVTASNGANAIISTTGDVTLTQVAISVSGKRAGSIADYIVKANNGSVFLKSTKLGAATVALTGSTLVSDSVGGVSAGAQIKLVSEDGYVASVTIIGSGRGLNVEKNAGSSTPVTDANAQTDAAIYLRGEGNSPALVAVGSGQAIVVNSKFVSSSDADVIWIRDSEVRRSASAVVAKKNLIQATGANVVMTGGKPALTKVRTDSTGTAASVAIFAAKNSGDKGGLVTVELGDVLGRTCAIDAEEVVVGKSATDGDKGLYTTTIRSLAQGQTIKSKGDVTVNNKDAAISAASGVAENTVLDPGAVIFTTGDGSGITIYNVKSVIAGGTGWALKTTKGDVTVYAGTIRSVNGTAIGSSGNVVVDGAPSALDVAAKKIGSVNVDLPLEAVTVSTNANNIKYSAITAKSATEESQGVPAPALVFVGKATVLAENKSGNAAAIRDTSGSVIVDNENAKVTSTSGTAVFVNGGRLVTGKNVAGVQILRGKVQSSASSNAYAAIWMLGGNVQVGSTNTVVGGLSEAVTIVGNWKTGNWISPDDGTTELYSNIVADNCYGIYSSGNGEYSVDLYKRTKLEVTGSAATAGAVKVMQSVKINYYDGQLAVKTDASKAFSLMSEFGQITVGSTASDTTTLKISSKSGEAIRSTGGKIVINGGQVTGDSGILVRSKDTTNLTGAVAAGRVTVGTVTRSSNSSAASGNRAFLRNKFGKVIVADVGADISGWKTTVETWTDTAVVVGTATKVGNVKISDEAWVQASGGDMKGNKFPVAVFGKQVEITDGARIFANTDNKATDDKERYFDSKATAVVIPYRKGQEGGYLRITPGGKGGTYVRAFGSSTGIFNYDTNTLVNITSLSSAGPKGLDEYDVRDGVLIQAGSGGKAIISYGDVSVTGRDETQDMTEETRDDGFNVRVKSGNGSGSRAISMPVTQGVKFQRLYLKQAIVEAGSDSAIAIATASKVVDSLYHSVVLVRHGSTAIEGIGGVFVNGSYIEVLATEANRTGTAIRGGSGENGINISGGNIEEMSKSEIHSKGIAVQDLRTGKPVQVTGTIHMTGTLASDLLVGSSVLGDSAILSMGSTKSLNLWKLGASSNLTVATERGKTLIVPKGITVTVSDNKSRIETESRDTLKVAGTLTTQGTQAGAQFLNRGKVIIDSTGGNIVFNKNTAASFRNNGGTVVLQMGSKLDNIALIHDTGSTAITGVSYTFLKWAKIFSGDSLVTINGKDENRGVGKVIIPPVYATLYGNQNTFVDEEDKDAKGNDFWTHSIERTDSVYTAQRVKYPLDRRYKPYLDLTEGSAKGDTLLNGQGTVRVDEDGTVLLTEAGTFSRTAVFTNEAGVGRKTYTHKVTKVDYNRIRVAQTETPIFFDGYVLNTNNRTGEDGDTLSVYEGGVTVPYTGSAARLLDGVRGARVPKYTNLETDKPIYYDGLGVHTFWYKGANYPLSSNVPTERGNYEVYASFLPGNNFERVSDSASSIVKIGSISIGLGDLESVFGIKDNDYQIFLQLQAGKSYTGGNAVEVRLRDVTRYGARYDTTDIDTSGSVTNALSRIRILATPRDSVLSFDVTSNSAAPTVPGDYVDFVVPVVNATEAFANLKPNLKAKIHVVFLPARDMVEATPSYIVVDYRNEKLSGLQVGTKYTINGDALTATSSDTAIQAAWRGDGRGDTITVVAVQAEGSYKEASAPAKIVIGPKQQISDALRAVKADDASGSNANGRLRPTTAAMEYRLSTETSWKTASPTVTDNLPAGTYYVRLAPVMATATTPGAFASDYVTLKIDAVGISVAESNREIPTANTTTEAAVAPVKVTASLFTAGPSPVSKAAGEISFFSSKAVKSGIVYIFDANGKSVAKAKVSGNAGKIGSANVSRLAEGSYVIKGALVGKDGTKSKVSFVFSVVK